MIQACIFDLDGVIVDTAKYHFEAWLALAHSLEIPFTKVDNEAMKGLSRKASLDVLLSLGDQKYSLDQQQELLTRKNDIYLESVKEGSASKNARPILDKIGLTDQFDFIVDGNDVKRAKPDPEVFLKGATLLRCLPPVTMVWEDSAKGIDAALAGGFITVGIGQAKYLNHAHEVISSLVDVDMNFILDLQHRMSSVRALTNELSKGKS